MAGDRRNTAILILALGAFLSGCLESSSAGSSTELGLCTAADTVRITSDPGTVVVGGTKQLSYATSAAAPACIRWSSSNDFIARMSSGGIIQGLAVGRVTIFARTGANVDSLQFNVVAASSSR
jgi:hypothetical protein